MLFSFISNKFGTKRSSLLVSFIVIICKLLEILEYDSLSVYGPNLLLILVFPLINNLFLITNESFPTNGRSLGSHLCYVVACISSFPAFIANQLSISRVIIQIIIIVCLIPSHLLLPEDNHFEENPNWVEETSNIEMTTSQSKKVKNVSHSESFQVMSEN